MYFFVVCEKVLVDHIRLFGGSENEVKMGFLWIWCKQLKKKVVFYYHN